MVICRICFNGKVLKFYFPTSFTYHWKKEWIEWPEVLQIFLQSYKMEGNTKTYSSCLHWLYRTEIETREGWYSLELKWNILITRACQRQNQEVSSQFVVDALLCHPPGCRIYFPGYQEWGLHTAHGQLSGLSGNGPWLWKAFLFKVTPCWGHTTSNDWMMQRSKWSGPLDLIRQAHSSSRAPRKLGRAFVVTVSTAWLLPLASSLFQSAQVLIPREFANKLAHRSPSESAAQKSD